MPDKVLILWFSLIGLGLCLGLLVAGLEKWRDGR